MDGSEEPEVRGKASNLKHAVKEAQLTRNGNTLLSFIFAVMQEEIVSYFVLLFLFLFCSGKVYTSA